MLPFSCRRLDDSKSKSSTRLPRTTTTRVSSGWVASISILLAMDGCSCGWSVHADLPVVGGGAQRRERGAARGMATVEVGLRETGVVMARLPPHAARPGRHSDRKIVCPEHKPQPVIRGSVVPLLASLMV